MTRVRAGGDSGGGRALCPNESGPDCAAAEDIGTGDCENEDASHLWILDC